MLTDFASTPSFRDDEHRQTNRTGYVNDTVNYGGNDCVMLDGNLYWNTSQFYTPFELGYGSALEEVGVVIAMDDAIPILNNHSAVSPEGTRIFANPNQSGVVFLLKVINSEELLVMYSLP